MTEATVADSEEENFWNQKAASYPLPFDDGTYNETRRLLSQIQARGVDFRGAAVLDIGCGTGIHALPIAREARRVTGLDATPAMIDIMAGEIARHGFTNVTAVCEEWEQLDPEIGGYAGAFDIVWSSMSPAIRGVAGLQKMEACSRRWCVYIGWGQKRENPLLEAAFNLHGLTFGPPPGVKNVQSVLSRLGRRFTIDYMETSWQWRGQVDAAVMDVAGYIQMAGFPPNLEKIRELLSTWEEDGMVRHTTDVEQGVLVWSPAEPGAGRLGCCEAGR